ncbi:MAG: HlyD family secretion protein [Blastocatellales bacterium]
MSLRNALAGKSKTTWLLIGAGLIIVLSGVMGARRLVGQPAASSSANTVVPQAPATQPRVTLACPGRIEGASEMVNVGAGESGLLREVRVREGQQVAAGDVLAVLDCGNLEAELQSARAAVDAAEQVRIRLVRGSRDEERRRAQDEQAREQAVLEQARSQHARMSGLFDSGDISRETVEKTKRDLAVAEASVSAAANRLALVNATPLPEELARADAEIKAAAERVNVIGDRLKKCAVRAPIAGTVLRVHVEAGEAVSTLFPQPIVSMVDSSRLRVRAEVDERDLSHIHSGQRVAVSAPAFAGREFGGSVARIAAQMGRQSVRTGDPAEKSDRDVLEVLIDLDDLDARLVIGLRVTVQFLAR